VSHPGRITSESSRRLTTSERYGRLPDSVLFDRQLTDFAKVVFSAVARHVFQGNVASIGTRELAKLLGTSQARVARAVRELVKSGAMENRRVKRGQRAMWVLASPVFGQKQGKVTEVVSSPSGGRRYASVDIEEVA
jgi:DNA-binding transcriptional MocR family regulator